MNKAVTVSKDKNGFFSVILTDGMGATAKLECVDYRVLSEAEGVAQHYAKILRVSYLSPIFRATR